ncbi:FtsX-like permease family protein [Flavobacteriaceae bacterium TP-CH-4]|uniref:FtsX-like permease family protein n=1 Tax=Pelagihabitans pacificus TaxID=2696054 RepID=A0A967E6S7_9FLAO|nr:ABC transporter permease [Pelagihabitans pacificus]NHF59925.1 FtsX-like permease family protein [Pelagihabitans pacificus]
MLKNYLKIAWRNLWKDKTYSSINILGLSVAFAVAILLSMAAFFELSYDNFHEHKDRVFQVYNVQQTPDGPEAGTSQPTPFAESLKTEVPGVDHITRVLHDNALAIYIEKEINLDIAWVDPDFFTMFTFPIIEGDQSTPLNELGSVVISNEAAKTLFGDTDIVGKSLRLLINGEERPFTVAAVMKDTPRNSTFDFDMALRFENNPEYASTKDSWQAQYHEVFAMLANSVSAERFESNSHAFIDLHYNEAIENAKRDGAQPDADEKYRQVELLPLRDVRFTSFRKGFAEVSRSNPYLILSVALLILFIAGVNYINMSMARSAKRLKEIGMRKTLGARGKQLFFQFWGESLLLFLVAMALGILLSALLVDPFKSMFRTGATYDQLSSPQFIVIGGLLVLIISLIVGGYPAFLLSRFGTVQSLKGTLQANGANWVRNTLMVVQFGIAMLLITSTLVLLGQIDYMRNKDLGYEKEQVISFPLNGKRGSYAVLELLKQELKGNPDILGVTGADNNLGRGRDGNQYSSAIGFEYKGRTVGTNFLVVDHDYVETLGLDMAMGRSFKSPADSTGILINEAMVKELREQDPMSAYLQINGDLKSPVLGVVKDYHFQDLDRAIAPLTFFMSRDLELAYAYVKVAPVNMADSYEHVKEVWGKIEPNADFLGSFLDENVDRTFRREQATAKLIASGSVLAILLSCIGLFAMSMLIVSQRVKEIGIRKVIGASVSSITFMLTKDFLRLLLLSLGIAAPISWWFLQEWLENYAYRIELHPGFFLAAGIMVVVIAIFTVSTKTIKAALQNPVKSLRTE